MHLRGYQLDALERLRLSFATGHQRSILVAPTGAGKTTIAASLVQGALSKGSRCLSQGKSEFWIRDHTAHKSLSMIDRYRRHSRLLQSLGAFELAPMHIAIPELAGVSGSFGQFEAEVPCAASSDGIGLACVPT